MEKGGGYDEEKNKKTYFSLRKGVRNRNKDRKEVMRNLILYKISTVYLQVDIF